MATKAHSLVSIAANHPVNKWAYANAAARTGATGFVATDLNTVAHQQDNDTYWILTATTPTWLQMLVGGAAVFTTASVVYAGAAGQLVDDGVNFSYAAGIVTLANGVTFTSGGTIASTSNGNIVLLPDGTGITAVGGGAGSHGLNAPGDLYVSGELEVDGVTYIDGALNITGNSYWLSSAAIFNDNVELRFGSASDAVLSYVTSQTPDTIMLGTGTDANSVVICEKADRGYDFAHAVQTNPTLFMQAATQSATEWGSIAHDQTDFVINSGTELVKLPVGLKHNVTTVDAATYGLLASDYFVHVIYTASGAVTSLTLPTAQTVSGRTIVIKDAGGNASANNITVDTQAAETIDGAATAVMNADYEWLKLYSDGSDWFIVGN